MRGERPLFPASELVSAETRRRWSDRVAFCGLHAAYLTDWEADFVSRMKELTDAGQDLSLGQSGKLNQVFHAVEEKLG
jgi:hypothetical protein